MPAGTDLLIKIGATLKPLDDKLTELNKRLKRVSFRAEKVGADLTSRVTLPIVAMGAAAVKTFADFDRMEKGLAALNGSAEAGQKQFGRLNNIVLDTRTTLDLRTAALGAQRLQGAGKSAEFAERTIKQLGIAATVSGSSIDDVGGVIRQFTQILGKGKIEQEDLNTILDRMPALGALIKEEFGASTAEGIRATGISMDEFVSRLTGAIEKNQEFQGVQGGLAKAFESFANAVQVGIRPLGEAISKALNLEVNLARLADFITRTSEAFTNLNPGTQRFIIVAAGAAAAIGPLSLGIGAAARAIPLLTSGISLLSGPLVAVSKAMIVFGGNTASAAATFLARDWMGKGAAALKVLFQGVNALKTVMAALLSPVGLAVAGITLLVGGFVTAYKRSQFFRSQLAQLSDTFRPLIDLIGHLAGKLLPDLGSVAGTVGKVFNVAFGVVGGIISEVLNSVIALANFIKLNISLVSDLINLDFEGAANRIKNVLTNGFGEDSAKSFGVSFGQTFAESVADQVENSDRLNNAANTAFAKLAGGFNIQGPQAVAPLPQGIAAPATTTRGPEPIVNEEAVKTLQDYRAELAAITSRQKLYGDSFDGVQAKQMLAKQTIDQLIDNGLKPQSLAIRGLVADLEQYKTASDGAAKVIDFGPPAAIDALSFSVRAAEASTAAFEARIRSLKPVVQDDLFADYREGLELITERQLAFGDSYDSLSAKIALTKETINGLINEGYSAQSSQVQLAIEQLGAQTEAQEELNNAQERQAAILAQLGAASNSAFDSVANAMAKGESAVKAFGNAVIASVRDAISAQIKLAVAGQVASALRSVPFPFNVTLAAAAGAGASALFNTALSAVGIPALAEGALVTGPQIALIGEAGPELVVPLNRVDEFRGGGKNQNSGGEVVFRISGNDLEGVLRNSNYQRA